MIIITEMADLPGSIKGFTTKNTDDSYTVFINSRLNIEQQRDAYIHEFSHIVDGDFSKGSADVAEKFAHHMRVNFSAEFAF